MSRSRGLGKRMFFCLSTALLCFALIEICAFFGYRIVRDDVDLWRAWRTSANEQDYRSFLARRYDPNTGWKAPRDQVRRYKNCLDEEWIATYDVKGARVHSSDRRNAAQILVVGDSFAHGSEVNDNETFPAQLERLARVGVANHGVGGFGPTQALIHLQSLLGSYKDLKVVIFSLMHGNIMRMGNAFRPATHPATRITYGFKPFVVNGALHENPNAPAAESWSEFQALAREAIRTDFWSRGEWSFPYTLSWINYARSNYFYFNTKAKLAKSSEESRPSYKVYYESDRLRRDLMFIIERFYELARSANTQPIVLFVPRRGSDLTSARPLVANLRARFESSEMAIIELGQLDIDWDAFNLKPGRCHPSPYGHEMIARSILEHLAF